MQGTTYMGREEDYCLFKRCRPVSDVTRTCCVNSKTRAAPEVIFLSSHHHQLSVGGKSFSFPNAFYAYLFLLKLHILHNLTKVKKKCFSLFKQEQGGPKKTQQIHIPTQLSPKYLFKSFNSVFSCNK